MCKFKYDSFVVEVGNYVIMEFFPSPEEGHQVVFPSEAPPEPPLKVF
jgi:hypothetical protein